MPTRNNELTLSNRLGNENAGMTPIADFNSADPLPPALKQYPDSKYLLRGQPLQKNTIPMSSYKIQKPCPKPMDGEPSIARLKLHS